MSTATDEIYNQEVHGPGPEPKTHGKRQRPLESSAFEPLAHESESNRAPEDVGVWIHEVDKNAFEERKHLFQVIVGG